MTISWRYVRKALLVASWVVAGCNCDADNPGPDGGGDGGDVQCAAGTWDADGDPASACVAWSDCSPGTYVAEEGTESADRRCEPCDPATFSTTTNVTACTAATVCAPGTYVSAPATPTSDRVCAACESGTFTSTDNAEACTTWTTCEPGEFVDNTPSTTVDRDCQPCAEGFYSSEPNSGTCAAIGTCAPGTTQTAPGSGTSPPTCATCPAGTFCPGGEAAPIPCMTGFWDDDQSAASVCVLQTECSAGFEIDEDGTATSDRTCVACTGDTYTDGVNEDACAPRTVCMPGERVADDGSVTANRVCTDCDAGSYSDVENATSCTAYTTCVPGEYVAVDGTAVADQTCASCPDGEYSSVENADACLPIGSCDAGTVQTQAGSPTQPATCDACAAGTYCAGGEAAAVDCEGETVDDDEDASTPCATRAVCQPGTRVLDDGDATHDRTCEDCAPGTFTATQNAATCAALTICQPGERVDFDGSTSADRTCEDCETGTYSDAENASTCEPHTNCQPGEEVTGGGTASEDRTCDACADGYFSSTINAESCTAIGACPAGTRQTAPGSGTSDVSCAACAVGNYCAGGTAGIVACGAGNWDHDNNAASDCVAWTACAANTYQSAPGTATTDRQCTRATSCLDIRTRAPALTSGTYSIDPDGTGPNAPFDVYCDMVTDGGGWTRISVEDFSTNANGWTNGARAVAGNSCFNTYGAHLGGYGNFGNGVVTQKTYDLLGITHTNVRVDLDYIVIDSWDNERARVSIDGALVYDQPYTFMGANLCGGSGWGEIGRRDVIQTRAHTANAMTLSITSTIDQDASDESFGVDDVVIMIR